MQARQMIQGYCFFMKVFFLDITGKSILFDQFRYLQILLILFTADPGFGLRIILYYSITDSGVKFQQAFP